MMDKFVYKINTPVVQQSNEGATKIREDNEQIELGNLVADPGLRIPISEYHPNIRDQVRRAYLQKGPCQPNNHNFKKRKIGSSLRRFNPAWFSDHKTWLEYSVEKEAVFCLCCYLFKTDVGRQGGGDAFVKEGFDAWNKNDRFDKHVGGPNSAHNQAWRKCEDLMRQDQHIDVALNRHSDQIRKEYRIRLGASIDCVRFLLRQGLALRGHDESEESTNHGNFLELLKFLADHNKEIDAVVGKNAPSNLKVTSPDIQHDIINASAIETVNCIIDDLALANGELTSGHGLNQETNVKRAGETRWGSHYGTLVSVISMFESIIDVLDFIVEDGLNSEQRAEASNLLVLIQSFDFIFSLHLLKVILGITNELSMALQRKEQDIVNAMQLVKLSKHRMQTLRNEGWDELLSEVCLFCERHNITFPSMDENFQMKGRSRRKVQQVTNLYHYKVDFFYVVLDLQLQELNNRFSESSMELLTCVACLSPINIFSAFDKEKLLRLAQFYPNDFSSIEVIVLENQLSTYILDMRSSGEFSMLNGISALAEKLVLTKKDTVYPFVYLLVKLALILPVSTASVERGFSAMKIIKSRLRNRMGDQLLNDSLVTYIEKVVFDGIVNEAIMQRFQNMKNRRGQL